MHLVTYFEKFVSNIQPTEERIKAASDHHNDLRDHLTSEEAELAFPVADSFLSGSYARSTAVDPIKDVDIILILKETKISDDRKTPSPRTVLADLKAGIDKFYDEVNHSG
jgi:tRNA nucleotidyltransferase (CCA-adding enzyme)